MDGSPAAGAALSALLPAAAPTIARLLDLGWSGSGDGGSSKDDSKDDSRVVDADAAAALLGDVCDVLSRLDGGEGEIVLRAAPAAAAEIAARCESSIRSGRSVDTLGGSESASPTPARRRWALLRALPHCAARDGVRRPLELPRASSKRKAAGRRGLGLEDEARLELLEGASTVNGHELVVVGPRAGRRRAASAAVGVHGCCRRFGRARG